MSNKNNDLKDNFRIAYDKLNPEQREAVDSIEGPVMVIAGPGTGKTQILTLRIANILRQTDTKPEQILALTFTEAGVEAMRARLVNFIGVDAYCVPIHTFHGFAGELIRSYPELYENIIGGRLITDIEDRQLMEELLDSPEYKLLRPSGDPAIHVKKTLDAIADLKKEDILPDDFASFVAKQEEKLVEIPQLHEKGAHKGKVRSEYKDAEKFLLRNRELLSLYRKYMAVMREKKLYDFGDMIIETIRALKSSEDMLLDVQEQYQYLLADEHQDVNESQNHFIELIASYHERPNIFVVGDEKQAIYRFQGASLENFLYFEDAFGKTETISLTNNYRSDQEILDVAQDVIATDDVELAKLRVPLKAVKKNDVLVSRREFSHLDVEHDWVIERVKEHSADGVALSEIAIIVRNNSEIEELAGLLRKAGLPVEASAERDILKHPITHQVKKLIQTVVKPEDEVVLAELLHAPYFGIDIADMVLVLGARSYDDRLIKIIGNESTLTDIGVKNTEPFLRIHNLITNTRATEVTETPTQVIDFLLQESGLLEFVIKTDPLFGAMVVRRIYDEVDLMVNAGLIKDLKGVLKHLQDSETYDLPLSASYVTGNTDAVKVMTAHKSKGLEFEVVILPHLTDNVWGASRSRSSFFLLPFTKHILADTKEEIKQQTEDDERRLFYVAMTRAKRVLEFSYSNTNTGGRSLAPSRFLAQIEDEKITECSVEEFENEFSPIDAIKVEPKAKLDIGFLRRALTKKGWSASSFNNYVKSPWKYVYENALGFPRASVPAMLFGTAVHNVLEKIVDKLMVNEEMSVSEISDLLHKNLSKVFLSPNELARYHEKGLEALVFYLPHLKSKVTPNVKSEYAVKAVLPTGLTDLPEVQLTGKFDRVDFDKEGNVLRVTDYKTGKPKTRGQMEGTTKDSDGGQKRQLVFYALLLSLQKDERLHCRQGVLTYVEPGNKAEPVEEAFAITDAEIDELKTQIIEATKAVYTGECLRAVCDESKCEYCHLIDVFENKSN